MNIILSIIATYPITYILKVLNVRDVVNDAAKNGFIVNFEKFKTSNQEDKIGKIEKYVDFIPIVNMFNSFNSLLDYKFSRDKYFEIYRVYGYFEPMTIDEEKYYKEKPTFMRALNISSKRRKTDELIEKNNIKSNIKYYDNNLDEHQFIIEKDKKYEEITLEKLIETMSKEELLEFKDELNVINNWSDIFDNDKTPGDYNLNNKNGKHLILKFKCKQSDEN
jgi:hypothetical protein